MKDKIIAALKTKYTNMGFSDKAFDGVADYLSKTVTEEKDIDNAIGGVEPILKAFQSEVDSRVTSAVEKVKKDLKTVDPDIDPATGKKKVDPNPNETPEQKAIRELQAELNLIKQGKTHETLGAKVKDAMKAKNLPDAVISMAMQGRTFEKEEDIEPFVTQVEESHKQYVQQLADNGLKSTYTPAVTTSTPVEKVEADIKSWAAKDKPADGK